MSDVTGSHFAEFGTTGLLQYGGRIAEEWHRDLSGEQAVKVYREMSDNDAIAGAFLYAAEQLLSQTKRQFEPAVPDNAEASAIADRFNEMLDDMESTPSEIISEVLQMMIYGWAYMEQTFKLRRGSTAQVPQTNSKYADGFFGWRDWGPRSQDTLYRWEIDERGKTRGMWQQAMPTWKLKFIPSWKALHFKLRARKGNPEGRSMLRNGYRTWYFLKKFEELEAIGIERDLAGLPKMEVPQQLLSSTATAAEKSALAKFQTLVQRVRRDEYEGLVVPHESMPNGDPSGYRFSLVSTGGRRPIDTNEIIKRKQSRILMSVMCEFLMLGMDSVGSFALSSNKTEIFAVALGNILTVVDDVINRQGVPRIMALNQWPMELSPKHTHGDIEVPDLAALAGYVGTLAGVGALTVDDKLEDALREYASLPMRDVESTRSAGGMAGMPTPRMIDYDTEPTQQADSAASEPPRGMR